MGIFDFFKKNKKTTGIINKFDLNNWWENVFSEDEREYIVSKYPSLIEKDELNYQEPVQAILAVAGYFQTKEDSDIANRFYDKAEELVDNIIDLHFIYNGQIKTLYKKRNDDPKYLQQAIKACKRQIKIADKVMENLKIEHKDKVKKSAKFNEISYEKAKKDYSFHNSSHRGFKQLAIIRHKQGKYEKVIELCKKAKKQGWYGDWDKRIEKAQNKLE